MSAPADLIAELAAAAAALVKEESEQKAAITSLFDRIPAADFGALAEEDGFFAPRSEQEKRVLKEKLTLDFKRAIAARDARAVVMISPQYQRALCGEALAAAAGEPTAAEIAEISAFFAAQDPNEYKGEGAIGFMELKLPYFQERAAAAERVLAFIKDEMAKRVDRALAALDATRERLVEVRQRALA